MRSRRRPSGGHFKQTLHQARWSGHLIPWWMTSQPGLIWRTPFNVMRAQNGRQPRDESPRANVEGCRWRVPSRWIQRRRYLMAYDKPDVSLASDPCLMWTLFIFYQARATARPLASDSIIRIKLNTRAKGDLYSSSSCALFNVIGNRWCFSFSLWQINTLSYNASRNRHQPLFTFTIQWEIISLFSFRYERNYHWLMWTD